MSAKATFELGHVRVFSNPLAPRGILPPPPTPNPPPTPGGGQGQGQGRSGGQGSGVGVGKGQGRATAPGQLQHVLAAENTLSALLPAIALFTVASAAPPQPPDVPVSGVVAFGSFANDITTGAVTFGTGVNVLTSNITFAADGTSSYLAEIRGAGWSNTTTSANNLLALVLDGAQGNFLSFITVAGVNAASALAGSALISAPSAGSHTVNVRFYVSGGTGKLLGATSLPPGAPIVVYVLKLG